MTNVFVVPVSVWINPLISIEDPQGFRGGHAFQPVFSTGCGKRCGKAEVLHTVCGNNLSKITKLLGQQPNFTFLTCGKPYYWGVGSPHDLWKGEALPENSTMACG